MSLTVKAGTRLFSAVDSTELIVVKAPTEPLELTIGGVPAALSADARAAGAPAEGHDLGSAMGKRYVDSTGAVELLCTKPGSGVAALDGELLALKDAKPLPASD
jgi:hypothetical protein